LLKLKGMKMTQLWVMETRWLGKKKKLDQMLNSRLVDVQRKGKYIIWHFDSGFWIVNHLSMSGQWIYRDPLARITVHTRLSMIFCDADQKLVVDFVDPRKFGRLEVYDDAEFWGVKVQTKLSGLGPDTLADTITYEMLNDRIHKFTEAHPNWEIKPLLMEQTFLSGIGNIYASDICFLAGINPFKRASELTVQEIKNLEEAIPHVIKNAYDTGGSTIKTYKAPDGTKGWTEHMVYNMKYCRICKTLISKAPQSGRTTHWCSQCQPM